MYNELVHSWLVSVPFAKCMMTEGLFAIEKQLYQLEGAPESPQMSSIGDPFWF